MHTLRPVLPLTDAALYGIGRFVGPRGSEQFLHPVCCIPLADTDAWCIARLVDDTGSPGEVNGSLVALLREAQGLGPDLYINPLDVTPTTGSTDTASVARHPYFANSC